MADQCLSTSFESTITQLSADGWVCLPDFLPLSLTEELRQCALQQWQGGAFHAAGIGQGDQQQVNRTIRGDDVLWLETEEEGALADIQRYLKQLSRALNQQFYLGIFESEMHFAVYPAQSGYHKHIDNFKGDSPRLLTFVLYLNDGWREDDGGQLRLYLDDSSHDILPRGGTMVLFFSDQFYHEVLPAKRQRISLTGWLRRRAI